MCSRGLNLIGIMGHGEVGQIVGEELCQFPLEVSLVVAIAFPEIRFAEILLAGLPLWIRSPRNNIPRRGRSILALLHLPQRSYLALQGGRLIINDARSATLPAELFLTHQGVAALSAHERGLSHGSSSGFFGHLVFGSGRTRQGTQGGRQPLESFQHAGAFRHQRFFRRQLRISRECLGHQACHQLASMDILLVEALHLREVKLQRADDCAFEINRH